MLYSTNTQYAIRGLAELAGRAGQGSLMLEQLVAGTSLPREFLGKIFRQLVKANLLTSSKGRGGGFALARPKHDITLFDIVTAIDGPAACDQCVLGLKSCSDQSPCPEHDLFKPIRHRLKDYLKTTTLADLLAEMKEAGR
jgi:Rrf2 family protein